MPTNPYQPPVTEPPPSHTLRKLASLGAKILSVPIGLFAGAMAVEASGSVIFLLFLRFDWLLFPAFGIGIVAGLAAGAYCFRIANAIHSKAVGVDLPVKLHRSLENMERYSAGKHPSRR